MNKPQRDSIKADNPRYKDYPEFTPDLSPNLMAQMGSFDGAYFFNASEKDLNDIPQIIVELQSRKKDKNNNMFKAKSGMSLEEWQQRGWINKQDPLGWYQWYIRFHNGRRTSDDQHQINRWRDFIQRWTPKSRQALINMNPKAGTRQALLHWGIHPWKPEISIEKSEADEKYN